MAQKMADEHWREFVSSGTRTGRLATVRADGAPHVAPIWFLIDGDDVVFSTAKDSVKGRSLVRDGRFSLCVDDDRPPFSFVVLNGRVRLSEDLEEIRPWAVRLASRYMGAEHAEEIGGLNTFPGAVLVRGQIESVSAVADVAA